MIKKNIVNLFLALLLNISIIANAKDYQNGKEELDELIKYNKSDLKIWQYGVRDVILRSENSENFENTSFVLYFSVVNLYVNDYFGTEKAKLEKMFEKENLENHYQYSGKIKLKNGGKFLYGKAIMLTGGNKILLELFFIDKDNNLKVKAYEKFVSSENFSKLIDDINSVKLEGTYWVSLGIEEEVTILTKKRKIRQRAIYLSNSIEILYLSILKLFENEIPKEFFEKREELLQYSLSKESIEKIKNVKVIK